jgi:hypothetical protein
MQIFLKLSINLYLADIKKILKEMFQFFRYEKEGVETRAP